MPLKRRPMAVGGMGGRLGNVCVDVGDGVLGEEGEGT